MYYIYLNCRNYLQFFINAILSTDDISLYLLLTVTVLQYVQTLLRHVNTYNKTIKKKHRFVNMLQHFVNRNKAHHRAKFGE